MRSDFTWGDRYAHMSTSLGDFFNAVQLSAKLPTCYMCYCCFSMRSRSSAFSKVAFEEFPLKQH